MTAANEKPLPCPFCGTNAALDTPNYGRCQQIICMACGAEGPEIRHGCLSDAIAAWNRRAQPAEAVDDAEYTQGFAYDGVVILKDGQPITIDEVLAMLNARSGAVDEAKEREAFEKWCKDNDYATSAPKWAGWIARARGGN